MNVSYFSDQFTENTSIQGGVVQTLAERWSVFANGGLRVHRLSPIGRRDLHGSRTGLPSSGRESRADQRRGSRRPWLAFSGNDSDLDPYAFDSHQVQYPLQWGPVRSLLGHAREGSRVGGLT